MPSIGIRIGELARRTGLTVRTLHHYHEMGLLVPSFHSPGEQRSYSEADVARLQQIKSLQALGFALREIGDALSQPSYSPLATVERHLVRVSLELEEARLLRARLQHVAERLRASESPSSSELIDTIQAITMFEKYYSPEQLDALQARADEVGQDRIRTAQAEWATLFAELAELRKERAPADDDRVLALGRRANALIEEFTGGDRDIRASLGRMHAQEGGQNVLADHGMELAPGLWEYLGQAMGAARAGA